MFLPTNIAIYLPFHTTGGPHTTICRCSRRTLGAQTLRTGSLVQAQAARISTSYPTCTHTQRQHIEQQKEVAGALAAVGVKSVVRMVSHETPFSGSEPQISSPLRARCCSQSSSVGTQSSGSDEKTLMMTEAEQVQADRVQAGWTSVSVRKASVARAAVKSWSA